MTTVFCIEILGESPVHKFLVQSGWSGKDYVFFYNQHTGSHLRAYRSIDEYRAERVDMHKSANIWPLLGNLLPEDAVEPHLFVRHREEAASPHVREEAASPNPPSPDAARSARPPRLPHKPAR
jgi:hypothetical protein